MIKKFNLLFLIIFSLSRPADKNIENIPSENKETSSVNNFGLLTKLRLEAENELNSIAKNKITELNTNSNSIAEEITKKLSSKEKEIVENALSIGKETVKAINTVKSQALEITNNGKKTMEDTAKIKKFIEEKEENIKTTFNKAESDLYKKVENSCKVTLEDIDKELNIKKNKLIDTDIKDALLAKKNDFLKTITEEFCANKKELLKKDLEILNLRTLNIMNDINSKYKEIMTDVENKMNKNITQMNDSNDSFIKHLNILSEQSEKSLNTKEKSIASIEENIINLKELTNENMYTKNQTDNLIKDAITNIMNQNNKEKNQRYSDLEENITRLEKNNKILLFSAAGVASFTVIMTLGLIYFIHKKLNSLSLNKRNDSENSIIGYLKE